jgi:hypothetical protein
MAVLGGKAGMTLALVPIAPAQMRLASVKLVDFFRGTDIALTPRGWEARYGLPTEA